MTNIEFNWFQVKKTIFSQQNKIKAEIRIVDSSIDLVSISKLNLFMSFILLKFVFWQNNNDRNKSNSPVMKINLNYFYREFSFFKLLMCFLLSFVCSSSISSSFFFYFIWLIKRKKEKNRISFVVVVVVKITGIEVEKEKILIRVLSRKVSQWKSRKELRNTTKKIELICWVILNSQSKLNSNFCHYQLIKLFDHFDWFHFVSVSNLANRFVRRQSTKNFHLNYFPLDIYIDRIDTGLCPISNIEKYKKCRRQTRKCSTYDNFNRWNRTLRIVFYLNFRNNIYIIEIFIVSKPVNMSYLWKWTYLTSYINSIMNRTFDSII